MTDPTDWLVIERLQQGIPLAGRPFQEMARDTGMSEDEFLRRARRLQHEGVIRRLGPRMRHRRAGISGNIMVVWKVPGARQDEVGRLFADDSHVSHCYLRPAFEGFPYTLYTMIHGPDLDAVHQTVRRLAQESGLSEYLLLTTVRELKKTSPVYRRPENERDEYE
ncbi:MAG: AsnC family transcriptional regulator [Acidobacteriota bacterium]|jgi:DNA-binding Lrp family transcriptional regulator|nr:AsnC family transcriptional regulator [Acidobacteriota bacterium]